MIIKGNKVNPCRRCGTAPSLAAHLQRTDTNERVDVLEMQGFAFDHLAGAFAEINATAAATRADKAAYHAKINPAPGETLTREQALHAADKLGEELGFNGQPRVVVEHEKNGRQHFHVVWSRIDLDRMKAIDTPQNYIAHERVSRELELEFGLSRTGGVHGRDEGSLRPARNSPEWEYQQAERLETKSPRQQKAEITALYAGAKNGAELQTALGAHGYTLARGDKEGVFLVVDERGGFASLARRVGGSKAAEIREKLADLDRSQLPTLDQARDQAKGIERDCVNLTAALDKKNLILARASAEDVKTYSALRETAKADSLAHLPPALREGQLCAVNRAGRVVFLNERTTGLSAGLLRDQLKGVDPATVPDVRLAAAANKMAEGLKADAKAEQREERRAALQEQREQLTPAKAVKALGDIKHEIGSASTDTFRVVGAGFDAAHKVMDKLADVAEAILSLFDPPAPRKISAQELAASKAARTERAAQIAERRERDEALDRIAHTAWKDRTVRYSDLVSLQREDLEQLKHRGDDGLRAMVELRERERERHHGRMLER